MAPMHADLSEWQRLQVVPQLCEEVLRAVRCKSAVLDGEICCSVSRGLRAGRSPNRRLMLALMRFPIREQNDDDQPHRRQA